MQRVPSKKFLISKVKKYTVEMCISFCYDCKYLSFSNKRYQPEMNFIENKYLTGLLMSYPGLLHVTI